MNSTDRTQQVARRIVALLNALINLRGLSDAEISRQLGYSNSTTLHKVRRGKTLLGIGRMSMLASIEIEEGLFVNLHWLITGIGPAITGVDGHSVVSADANELDHSLRTEAAEVVLCTDPLKIMARDLELRVTEMALSAGIPYYIASR